MKKAYRHKALETHPDRDKSPGAQARFVAISEAFRVLSDPDERAAYDQQLADEEKRARPTAAYRASDPSRPVSAKKQRRIDTLRTLESLFTSNQPENLKRDFGMRLVQSENDREVLMQIARSTEFYVGRAPKSPLNDVRVAAGMKLVEMESEAVNLFSIGTDDYQHPSVRVSARAKLVRNATMEDKDLLDGISRSSQHFIGGHADMFTQTRIDAGMKRVALETNPYELMGIAEDEYQHLSVRLAAGKRMADTATAAEKEALIEFSRSNSAAYGGRDALKNARIPAGMAFVQLEKDADGLRIIMNDEYSYMPVRSAAGFKLAAIEQSEPGLIQLFTEAKGLPCVQEVVRRKLEAGTGIDQKGAEFIRKNAGTATSSQAGRGIKLLR